MKQLVKSALLLAMMSVCLLGYVLHSQSGIFREFQTALLQERLLLLFCLAVGCGSFIFLTFSQKDLPLIGLLLIAVAAFFISQAANRPATDAIILLAGMTLGKGASVLLGRSSRRESAPTESGIEQSGLTSAAIRNQQSAIGNG